MVKPLTVYKASAGSGKTFTLATSYISLLIKNPQSYRNILAVTFTNKATEEMKMRIISQLYGIWKKLPASNRYLEKVQEKTVLSPDVISKRAGIALKNLLHNYNYFRVETIDTFFQRVLRNMARELDLTTNLRIGLNDIQVEELAVDRLIEDLSVTDVLLQWMMRYIMENISDDKSWNVIGQIKTFGRTIFRDDYKKVSKELEEKLEQPGFFEDYTERLKEIRQTALERMREIAESFFDTLDGEGLTIEDFSFGRTGVCSFFLKLQTGIFDESIIGKRVTDCMGNPEKWYKKTHERRELIHALVESTLGDILRYAIEERPRQWKLYKSADLTLKHLNQLRLLGSIERKVRELNADANRFLLSDTQQLLHSLIDGSDSPFIFEKIGTQLEHVMIDEFQDTSTIQWQNFKVLLNEAMSHTDSNNLIVGDVKQSIYRWRSGDWRLLNNIEEQFAAQQTETQALDTNYRSDKNIILFNNHFFHKAAELESQMLAELQNINEAEQLRKAYADVKQDIPKNSQQTGEVDICLLPAEDYQEEVLRCLAETVSDKLAQGIPQNKIAILVRTNALIPLIAQYFIEQMPKVSIVSDEAFRLDASSAVCLLIHAMRLLVHPEDQLTKAAIVKTWQCDIREEATGDEELLLRNCDLNMLLPEEYIHHTEELLTLPLYDLVERLYTIFNLKKLKDQSAYICAFYDQLTTFVNENTTDINTFLNEWGESFCSKTIQSDMVNGIRLISIHKSKGLEFDHVICPFCDWQLEKQSGNILWCRPKEAPFCDLPIAPIDFSQKQMMGTIYEADYCEEHLQNAVDNLNLLYVAFTRASHSLTVIGKRNTKSSRSAIIELVLPDIVGKEELASSTLDGQEDNTTMLHFHFGEPSRQDTISSNANQDSTAMNPFLQPEKPVTVAIDSFESIVDFRQSNRSRGFIKEEDEENTIQQNYIQMGSILHCIFSTIRTVDDIPDALQHLQFEGVLYDEHITAERITDMLRKRLSHPKVADWFSPHWTLFNECTILSLENGEVKERRPDRVMTDGKEWIVVDFKFGSPKEDYHEQVREYMQLLSSMGHQQITGYLWYVYSNVIEEVRS